MTDQHDASGAWPSIEDLGVNRLEDVPRCLLELRSRIEALEAAQLEQAESHRFCTDAIVWRVEALEAAYEETAMAELRAASAEARPAGSLVERVRGLISCTFNSDEYKARAAIREVAAWLDSQMEVGAAHLLSEEANRG